VEIEEYWNDPNRPPESHSSHPPSLYGRFPATAQGHPFIMNGFEETVSDRSYVQNVSQTAHQSLTALPTPSPCAVFSPRPHRDTPFIMGGFEDIVSDPVRSPSAQSKRVQSGIHPRNRRSLKGGGTNV